MNTYTKLKLHLERHVYKRGAHKGEAPAGKRWRTYVRVVEGNGGQMHVRMYGTNLLTAFEDGRVEIHTGGWYDRPTTKLRLNESFSFLPFHISMYSRKTFGMSQPILTVGNKRVLYYDGIVVNDVGEILTPLRPFERRRVDKAESKELRDDMAECGFTDVFNVLWSTCTPEEAGYLPDKLRTIVTHEYHANHWPSVVASYTWARKYDYNQSRYTPYRIEPKEAWAALMNTLRRDCYEVVRTETTTL
jgi:hypothetical protein